MFRTIGFSIILVTDQSGYYKLIVKLCISSSINQPHDISAVALGGESEVLLGLAVLAQLLGREVQQLLVRQLPLVPLQQTRLRAAMRCKATMGRKA